MVFNHIFARLIRVCGAARSHPVKLDTPTMLHSTFASCWLLATNKGPQDVFTPKGTRLLAKVFLRACWVSWLSGSTGLCLTQSMHSIICQTFTSSNTVADTALFPGGFPEMNETPSLQLQRFFSSQGNACKQRELRATREGKTAHHENITQGEIP